MYNDCCCDIYALCQRSEILKIFDGYLVDEDGSPELFYEFDYFPRVLRFIEDPSDLSLFQQH